jgi:hypothetical protein
MGLDTQRGAGRNGTEPTAAGAAPKAEPAQTTSGIARAVNNDYVGVQKFDMTEDEVRLWDTRVGMIVGLLLFVGAGSALVFGTIKLINWLNT